MILGFRNPQATPCPNCNQPTVASAAPGGRTTTVHCGTWRPNCDPGSGTPDRLAAVHADPAHWEQVIGS